METVTYMEGDRFLFEDEPIAFFQDFCFCRGLFPGVLLTLTEFTHNQTAVVLRGPGYGMKGQYGNGSIHVHSAELRKCSHHIPVETKGADHEEATR